MDPINQKILQRQAKIIISKGPFSFWQAGDSNSSQRGSCMHFNITESWCLFNLISANYYKWSYHCFPDMHGSLYEIQHFSLDKRWRYSDWMLISWNQKELTRGRIWLPCIFVPRTARDTRAEGNHPNDRSEGFLYGSRCNVGLQVGMCLVQVDMNWQELFIFCYPFFNISCIKVDKHKCVITK